MICEFYRVSPTGFDHINIPSSLILAHKGHIFSVRGKPRIYFKSRGGGQFVRLPPFNRGNPQVSLIGEDYPIPANMGHPEKLGAGKGEPGNKNQHEYFFHTFLLLRITFNFYDKPGRKSKKFGFFSKIFIIFLRRKVWDISCCSLSPCYFTYGPFPG